MADLTGYTLEEIEARAYCIVHMGKQIVATADILASALENGNLPLASMCLLQLTSDEPGDPSTVGDKLRLVLAMLAKEEHLTADSIYADRKAILASFKSELEKRGCEFDG